VLLRLEELERRDLPSQSGIGLLPLLQPKAGAQSTSKVTSTTTKGPDGSIYYRYGYQTSAAPLPSAMPGGLALEGGGTDINLLYQWMAARADNVDATVSNNALNPLPTTPTYKGDFLVLGTLKDNSYDSYIYNLALQAHVPLNSVATLDIPSISAANSSFVTSKIESAAAIFIMGGDQSTYVNNWQGTAVQTALDAAAAQGVPIGGTSAGANILSQLIYSAENISSAVSSDVLANPYSSEISLDKDFLSVPSLPYLENTIADPHFFERDRMGRTVTFLARLVEDPQWTSPSSPGGPTPLKGTMAIGIDQSTALLIDTVTNTVTKAGDATIIGNSPSNHVYFLTTTGVRPTLQSSTTNTIAAPLSWGTSYNPAIQVYRATVGDNLTAALDPTTHTVTWTTPTASPLDASYMLWVTNGTVNTSQTNGAIY
jgi:cyanophycinase-like exopeptidase